MSERTKSFVRATVFLALTLFLVYAHFQTKKEYTKRLEGYKRLKNGDAKKANVLYDEKYGELTLKSKSSDIKQTGTIVTYSFMVNNKTYQGKMASMNKPAEEMIMDSLYYLPEDPSINSLHPEDDYQWQEAHAPWNWRLYLGILTALGIVGSFMHEATGKDKKD